SGKALAAHALDVLLVLQQDAERLLYDVGVERVAIERDERRGPVERLGQTRGLVEIERAQFLDERRHLRGETRSRAGHLRRDDAIFLAEVRVLNPPVQAPPLQRVVHLAGAVRRDDDNGRVLRPY